MRRLTAATAATAVLALAGSLLGTVPAVADPATTPSTPTTQQTLQQPAASTADATDRAKPKKKPSKPKPAPMRYTPRKGVLFNNPLGGVESRRRIIGHLIRTIESVPGREKIKIASWNIRSDDITDALVRAHNRGVSVRLVMDRANANPSNPNDNITRLAGVLRTREKHRKPAMRSSITRCVSGCRHRSGIAHNKFFLFSKAGRAKDVVIYGSNNATDLAAYAQWNDVYTMVGKSKMYDLFEGVFDQMLRDKNIANPYESLRKGDVTTSFYPYKGRGATGDPLLAELGRIVCQGATGGTGTHGRTKIRIAQTSMHGDRGKAIAQRLAQMWARGCDIKIVYAVFGNEVLRILRNTPRGAVPIRQIAQDHNLDGVYDRYLHMKNMAVSGVYGGRTDANVTWNGSANWTSVALASDEVVVRIYGAALRARYGSWVDYLFAHPPRFSARDAARARAARQDLKARGISPYSQMELD